MTRKTLSEGHPWPGKTLVKTLAQNIANKNTTKSNSNCAKNELLKTFIQEMSYSQY
jgi:hypothetical protein